MAEAAAASERPLPIAPEFFVRDVGRSLAFYSDVLGFVILRREPDFAVVALGDAHVLLAAESLVPSEWLSAGPRGTGIHVRIIVADVDAMYERAKSAGIPIVHDIADRYYGLRDFILADPDGFLLRFASPLSRA